MWPRCWIVRFQNCLHGSLFVAILVLLLLLSGSALILLICVVVAALLAALFDIIFNSVQPAHADKAVLITGCSSGIGREACLRLANAGFTVFAGVRRASDSMVLNELNPRILPVLLDVTDQVSIKDAVVAVDNMCKNRSLHLHALVLSHGVGHFGPLLFMNEHHVNDQFAVNVTGTLNVVNMFVKLLQAGSQALNEKARLVMVNSGSSRITLAGESLYGSSKRASLALAEGWRMELKPFMNVTSVEPGVIETGFHNAANVRYSQALADVTLSALETENHVPSALPVSLVNHLDRCYQNQEPVWSLKGSCDIVADAIELAIRQRWQRTCIRAGDDVAALPFISLMPSIITDYMFGSSYRYMTETSHSENNKEERRSLL